MWTWTFGASIMMSSSAARGEQPHELRDHLGLRGVVDERSLATALDEPGPAQQVEVVRERGARDLQLRLDLAHGDLAPLPDEEEEDLQPRRVRERLERLDVLLGRLELNHGKSFHVSKSIDILNDVKRSGATPPA